VTFDDLVLAIGPTRGEVVAHPIYFHLTSVPRLRVFMEHHVWAVWDFMSLLTALQRECTSTTLPWVPSHNTTAARFVNEIKVAEESDVDGDDGFVSHVDLYLKAMGEAGADTGPLERTMRYFDSPSSAFHLDHVWEVARKYGAPEGAVRFLATTFSILEQGSLPHIAAAFTLGREQLIPAMFEPLLHHLDAGGKTLRYYLDRHIEIDGDSHGPLARALVESVCDTEDAWAAARHGAVTAVMARRRLWDDTLDAMLKGT
jgi:hypothetical protein